MNRIITALEVIIFIAAVPALPLTLWIAAVALR